ncbi:hypothetical protein I4U23_005076 [Adineta vaga]|nr:hypothetical protein I4U23_005076 [Adineta vaga]
MLFLFSSLLLLICVQSILCCSCPLLPIDVDFAQSPIIFIGRVIATNTQNSHAMMTYTKITMEVEESFKGVENGSQIVVHTESLLQGSSCYVGTISKGERWQIWSPFLQFCSRSTRDVNKDLDILRNLAQQLNTKQNIPKDFDDKNIPKENNFEYKWNDDNYNDMLENIDDKTIDIDNANEVNPEKHNDNKVHISVYTEDDIKYMSDNVYTETGTTLKIDISLKLFYIIFLCVYLLFISF